MNAGPFPFARQMMGVENLLSGAPNWDGLSQAFFPAAVPDNFDPGTDMKQVLYHFYQTAEGRRIIDWIADLTVRAPYPHIGSTVEAAALAAKAHEARAAVGYAIGRAIADGEELYKQSKGATT